MPKKKPIDKRLNKLFTDITPEQAQTDPKAGSVERAPTAFPSSPLENAPASKAKGIQPGHQEYGCARFIHHVFGLSNRSKYLGDPPGHG